MTEIPISKPWASAGFYEGTDLFGTFGFRILNLFRVSDFVFRIFTRNRAHSEFVFHVD